MTYIPARYQFISNYVQHLRSILNYYTGYIPPTSYMTEAYEALQQDPVVSASINKLSLFVSGKDWDIITEEKNKNLYKVCSIIKKLIKNIKGFTHARKSLAMGALHGMSVLYKNYTKEYKEIEGIKGVWYYPKTLQEIDIRRFRLERLNDNEKSKFIWSLWSPKYDKYVKIMGGTEFEPDDFIWYYDEKQEDQPYGLGLGHRLYSICWLKSKIIQYRAELAETWARPWLIGKLDLDSGTFSDVIMSSVSAYPTQTARVDTVLDVLDKMRARHILVMSQDDDLQIKEAGSTQDGVLDNFLNYLDDCIRNLILGSKGTSSNGGGSYAREKVFLSEQDAIIGYRQSRLEETLTEYLINDLIYRNKHLLYSFGIKYDEIKFKIDPIEREDEKNKRSDNLELAFKIGLSLKESEVYESLGFTPPLESDKIVRGSIND